MLACGTVCHLSACAGAESCTQICGLLGDIRSRRDVQFIVYDNACMLARFVRNRAARRRGRGSSSLQQLASECSYVLDRFHARNHRACLNPQHVLYLPEVDIARHPALAALNTSQNEQWNNWLGHFSHTLRHMHFRTMELYLLLVADLWNTFVVPCRSPGDATPQPSEVEERPTSSSLLNLKRRRDNLFAALNGEVICQMPQLCSGLSKRNVAAARLSFPAALVSVRQAASIHLAD